MSEEVRNNQVSLDTFVSRIPQNKEQLDTYLRYFYGFYLASVPIETGNSCPLDFAWDIYSSAMGLKETVELEDFNFLGMAARSGQKSLTCAAIELLMVTFDQDRDYFHMASIYDQSKITYGYVQGVLEQAKMRPIVKSTTMKETISAYGRMLKIGTGTVRSVNCFAGDQLLHTDHGYRRIEELFIGHKEPMRTTTYDGLFSPFYLNNDPITNVTYSGRSETLTFEFDDGGILEVTPGHKCIVNSEQPILAKDIRIGDCMVFQHSYNSFLRSRIVSGFVPSDRYKATRLDFRCDVKIPNELSPDLAYLMGLIIGDGGMSVGGHIKGSSARGGRITYTSGDFVLLDYYKSLVISLFGKIKFRDQIKNGAATTLLSNTIIKEFLNYLGLSYASVKQKRIPSSILIADAETQWAFISGYFDADGSIRVRHQNSVETVFYSASRRLLLDLQTILVELGVSSRIRRQQRHTGRYAESVHYILSIKNGLSNFLSNICSHKDVNSKRHQSLTRAKSINDRKSSLWDFKFVESKKIVSITKSLSEKDVYDLYSPPQGLVSIGGVVITQSFHGSIIQDETDLTDHKVFTESKGMLSPGRNGKSPLDVKISSRKFAFGNIQSLITKKEKDPTYPLRIHKWGILEMMQRCPTSRSITEDKTDTLFVDEENLHAITKQQWLSLTDDKKRADYQPIAAYPGCHKCGIFSFCKGLAKKQVADNPFLIAIDDVLRLYLTDDLAFFKSQRLNRKPSTLGLIFGVWDGTKHVRNYEAMFEIFSGREWGSIEGEDDDLTLEIFVKYLVDNGCKLYMGVDFGFNVAVALLMLKDGSDRIYVVDEAVVEGRSDADFALICWEKWKWVPLTRGFGDVASPGAIYEFAAFFPMLESIVAGQKDLTYQEYAKLSKNYQYRFGLIRKLLSAPGSRIARLFVSPTCSELISFMPLYRAKVSLDGENISDVPADGQRDHAIDALGHGIVGLFVAGGAMVTTAIATVAIGDDGGPRALHEATPESISTHLGGTMFNIEKPTIKPRSVPIDPHTGEAIVKPEPIVDPVPRGNKKFKFTFME